MGLPDIVYLVRPGDDNPELRFSLRSLTNLPHRQVWLAGYQPSWTAAVGRIKVRQGPRKWDNQASNLAAACAHPDVADRLILFNDDFFVLKPTSPAPMLHRGPIGGVLRRYRNRRSEYASRLRATADHVGQEAPAYDSIHVPMPLVKDKMASVLDDLGPALLFRTVYGNRWKVGGQLSQDVKIAKTNTVPTGRYASTSDTAFRCRPVGRHIRDMFPDPSPYEAA